MKGGEHMSAACQRHRPSGPPSALSAELSARTSGLHVRFVSTGTYSWSRTNRTDKFFPIRVSACPETASQLANPVGRWDRTAPRLRSDASGCAELMGWALPPSHGPWRADATVDLDFPDPSRPSSHSVPPAHRTPATTSSEQMRPCRGRRGLADIPSSRSGAARHTLAPTPHRTRGRRPVADTLSEGFAEYSWPTRRAAGPGP